MSMRPDKLTALARHIRAELGYKPPPRPPVFWLVQQPQGKRNVPKPPPRPGG